MAHSIELLLDADTDAAIRRQWRALDDAGLPSQQRVTSSTNRPHLTLLAARSLDVAVDDALRDLRDLLPLHCVLGAPLVFGGPRMTLARLVVPSTALLTLHEEVYRRCLPWTDTPFGHCAPGHWTPHVTLGRRFAQTEIGAALAVTDGQGAELAGRAVQLRRWDSDARTDHLLH